MRVYGRLGKHAEMLLAREATFIRVVAETTFLR